MSLDRLSAIVQPLIPLTALVLLVDLFLDWRVASVSTPTLELSSGTSGLAGWGIVAGVLLVATLLWEQRLLGRGFEPGLQEIAIATALALGAAGFTVVAFFTGEASVSVAGVVHVSVEEVQWAAYAGLALAGLLAVLAVVRYVDEAEAHATPRRTTAHGAV
jgi:hypothetical protein